MVRTHAGFILSSAHRNIETLPVFCIPPPSSTKPGHAGAWGQVVAAGRWPQQGLGRTVLLCKAPNQGWLKVFRAPCKQRPWSCSGDRAGEPPPAPSLGPACFVVIVPKKTRKELGLSFKKQRVECRKSWRSLARRYEKRFSLQAVV